MSKQMILFGALAVTWLVSVVVIMGPGFGLAPPVFPRPDPDYALYVMIVSGISLVIASMKTGFDYLKP